jgi:hypothetical protein
MQRLTAEQITAMASKKATTDTGMRKVIHRCYLDQDESYLFPIHSRFNVTIRAIRHVSKFEEQTDRLTPLEYCYQLESCMAEIVNKEMI